MSEETKTAEGDYVMMGAGAGVAPGRGGGSGLASADDPNISQEEKDHRLAVALQQQENAAALDQHKKHHDAAVAAQASRTARSGTFTKLAAVRQKDHGMLTVPAEYTSDNAYVKDGELYHPPNDGLAPPPKGALPQEVADHKIAADLQKFEQIDAGTTRTMAKMVEEETQDEEAQHHRTERSNYHINQKGLFKKR